MSVEVDRAATFEAAGDLDEINRLYRERRWSDGLPIVPPTAARVERMLAATQRARHELVARVAPGFGSATVERVAINAVMAGCDPQYLPALLAATEAIADPAFNLQGIQATTNPVAVWLVINGPAAKQLNVNEAFNCIGQGRWSNATIGRAMRLVLQNIGGALPGEMDRATQGQPGKFTFCCAENEEASPWEPLHVERGYAREASTVTVHFVYGMCELHDFRSTTPEDLIGVFATAATNVAQVGTGLWLIGRRADPRTKTEEKEHNPLFICPEHADIFARAGWGRSHIQDALYRAARLPFRTMMLNKEPKAMAVAHPELGWMADHPELPVPIVEDPGCFDIAVVGGAAGRGAYFYGAGEPVTVPVEE